MTRPGTASEPTMDEILASIRKIIAEDPQPKGSNEPTFAALAPQPAHNGSSHNGGSPSKPASGDRPGALMDRIATAVRTAPESGPANGADRGDALYGDIDDMLADAPLSPDGPAGGSNIAPPSRSRDEAVRPMAPARAPGRTEPSFSPMTGGTLPQPAAAAKAPFTHAGAAPGGDAFGQFVPDRNEAPHAAPASVASRLPPLGGAPLSSDLGPFAVVRPAPRPEREEPVLSDPPAPQGGRLAAASWPDTLRRAEAAADQPAEPVLPMPPAASPASASPSEPVVLAAMPAPAFPPLKATSPAPATKPVVPSANAAAPLPSEPAFAPLPDSAPAASGPVVLAAMPPLKPTAAARPVPPPAAAAAAPAKSGDPLAQTLSDITRLGASAKPSAKEEPQPANLKGEAKPGHIIDEPKPSPFGEQKTDAVAESPKPAVAPVAASKPVSLTEPANAAPRTAEVGAAAANSAAGPFASRGAAGGGPAPALAADADTSAAAASALGALAAGLAASSSKSPSGIVAPPQHAAASSQQQTPSASAQPDIVAGLAAAAAQRPVAASFAAPPSAARAPAPAPAPVAQPEPADIAPSEAFLALANAEPAPIANLPSLFHGGGAIEPETALDDTVAELLRPMLRQWLSENMPRIVEKALRIELAEGLKADQEPNARR